MADVTEKVCDYSTGKLNCQKRKDVRTVVIHKSVVVDDEEKLIAVYKRDLCPAHEIMMTRNTFKVMGDPAEVFPVAVEPPTRPS